MPLTEREQRIAMVKEKIRRMGRVYQPGNASREGHLYSPLPFADFSDVPVQRTAVEARFEIIRDDLLQFMSEGTLLDVGCHAGFNCFKFNDLGFQCSGIEADSLTVEIARDAAAIEGADVSFRCTEVTPDLVDELGHYNAIIFTAVFQWITLAQGFESAKEVLRKLTDRCEVLYFETSMGEEGKAKMPMLPNREAVESLLRESGHSCVELIGALDRSRFLFRTSRLTPAQASIVSEIRQAIDRCATTAPIYEKRNRYFFSRVWKAELSDGQCLAIKFVEPLHAEAAPLLTREHEFLAQMQSPHFPQAIMNGTLGNNYVLVSEWIEGRMLSDLLSDPNAQLDRAAVADQLREIQQTLAARGVTHRDIRDRNLICTPNRLVLFDFGWSTHASDTACFTPPELVNPDDSQAIANLLAQLQ